MVGKRLFEKVCKEEIRVFLIIFIGCMLVLMMFCKVDCLFDFDVLV